jgi:hypothetical protein
MYIRLVMQLHLPSPTTTTFTAHRPSSLPIVAIHPHKPLPSPEGCGLARSCSTGGYGGKNTRGDPANGRPSWCVARTGHGIFRGPFSLIPLSLTPTNALEPHTTPTACVATAMTTSQGPPWLSDPHDDTKSSTPAYDEAECQTTWQRAQEGLMTTCPAQSRQVGPNDNA